MHNPKGEDVGKINDLTVDMNTGALRYAILEFDPGIFHGETLFGVPTAQLHLDADHRGLVYDMSKTKLEQAAIKRDKLDLAALDRNWG